MRDFFNIKYIVQMMNIIKDYLRFTVYGFRFSTRSSRFTFHVLRFTSIAMIILIIALSFNSCGLVESMAGASFDPEQLAKAREAKIIELRLQSATALKLRLSKNEKIDDADINIYLDEKMVNDLLDKYKSSSGMLDEATDYTIKDIKLQLLNGSAIASIELLAHNEDHNVDIQLVMDCLLTIETIDKDMGLKLEPFNIAPVVTTRGIYSAAKDIINKLIKLNLAELSKKLPHIKIPVNIDNKIPIDGSKTDIKSKINLSIENPQRNMSYNMVIKEILFFEDKIFIALNINKIEAK